MNLRQIFTGLLLLAGLSAGSLHAQDEINSRNGWQLAPEGRLHILVIFAEINFDSTYGHLDPIEKEGKWLWPAGQLPTWKDKLIARNPEGDGFMTEYFRHASFGKYQVTGDYVDQLITVNISDIRDVGGNVVKQEAFANRYYKGAVIERVNAIQNLKFGKGSKLEDFDNLSLSAPGKPKTLEPNGKLDLVMIVWRNIHVHNLGENSGFVNTGDIGVIKGLHSDMYSQFRTSNFLPRTIMRHEFSHMLYGGNNFHTANGGVGARTFMSTVGGWSNMSASDACMPSANAWDRERLGWQNPENTYLINARCQNGNDINGELTYGESNACGSDVYVLRDFVSTGDAIKIKLPHLPDGVKNQYLWLENHQKKTGEFDIKNSMPEGLYAYIQAGKDDRTGRATFGGPNNYLWPLPAIGSYDFGYRGDTLLLDSDWQNPFTGYHFLMRHTRDLDGDGQIRLTTDVRPKTEYTLPNALIIDGEVMQKEYFSYETYPIFGVQDVPFRADGFRKMGIGHNPAAVPVYTHIAPGGPQPVDNRRIYLNGISVEVLRRGEQGELYLKIRWDDYDIVKDVRWCGNIVANEGLVVKSGNAILLDQGYSAQVNKVVQEIDGEAVFAEPTVLELRPESKTLLENNAELRVAKGSTLIVRAGAWLDLAKNANVIVEDGAFIYLETGANITFSGKKAKFDLKSGAKRGINPLLEPQFLDLQPALPAIPDNPN